ncbi:MAG: heme lyase CcmF/NrfE family subunit [Acidimicrobiales bacterium]
MNGALGHGGVLLGFAASVAGIGVLGTGLARKSPGLLRAGRVYAWLVLAGALVAVVAMEHALVTHDFSLAYVAANNSRATPLLYSITGLWSALAGSILLWGTILAVYVAAMVWRFRRHGDDEMVAWATLVSYSVAAFFFGLMVGPSDPFVSVAGGSPANGLGPNVLLQDNPLVTIHPPVLYAGFVGFTIPFAFAIAALATGRVDERWQLVTRRWTLFAWACLSVGIVLGAWWSYQVLGWGGFWAWDPVENASLLPWLCATAYLHSVLVQERRGLLRVWNLSLVVSVFALTILATFLTRSGVIQSVHAFSESDIGPALLCFLGVVVAVGVGLIAWRGDRLRSPGGIDAPVSREGAFLLNNVLFVAFAFVVLLGTLFPLLYEAFSGQQVTVGSPYFNAMTLPLGLALLLLMAVGPVLAWRKADPDTLARRLLVPGVAGTATIAACVVAGVRGLGVLVAFGTGAFAASANIRQLALAARAAYRHRVPMWRGVAGRANGGMVVHVGVVIVAVAIASATSFGHRTQVTLAVGASTVVDGVHLTYEGLSHERNPAASATVALVLVNGHGPYRPAVTQFGAGTDAVGTPAIDSDPLRDVYLTIDSLPDHPGGAVAIGITVEPLVLWLWVGGAVVAVGALLALVPGRRRRPTDAVSAAPPTIGDDRAAADGSIDGGGTPSSEPLTSSGHR